MIMNNNNMNLYRAFHGTQGRFTDRMKVNNRSNNTQQSKKHQQHIPKKP